MGSRGWRLTMNGMERKAAKQSVALECYGVKRKPLAAGLGRKTIHVLHLRRVVGCLRFFTGYHAEQSGNEREPSGQGVRLLHIA